jgi:hypothetical protein
MITLLLKPNDISEIVGFGGNIDVDQLKPSINVAQTTHIKRILGNDLYTKIYNDYSGSTLSGDYLTIYNDYVVYMLSFFAASTYLTINTTKTTNSGSYKIGVDGSQNTPPTEINSLAKNYEAIAINYERTFYEFIKTISIPEYGGNNDTSQQITSLLPWY